MCEYIGLSIHFRHNSWICESRGSCRVWRSRQMTSTRWATRTTVRCWSVTSWRGSTNSWKTSPRTTMTSSESESTTRTSSYGRHRSGDASLCLGRSSPTEYFVPTTKYLWSTWSCQRRHSKRDTSCGRLWIPFQEWKQMRIWPCRYTLRTGAASTSCSTALSPCRGIGKSCLPAWPSVTMTSSAIKGKSGRWNYISKSVINVNVSHKICWMIMTQPMYFI